MKVKVTVNVVYEFEFETNNESRVKIQEEAEDLWNKKLDFGLEDAHFCGTEVEWDEV